MKKPKLFRIELDIMFNEGFFEGMSLADVLLKELQLKYKLSTKVINLHGPGGGWPVVEIIGTKANLNRYIDRYTSGHRGDFGTDAIEAL